MPKLLINGVNYHYRQWGDGAPLVALHGFTGAGTNWADLAAMLPTQTIIAPDIIGHGQTDAPDDPARYRIENAAADIIELSNQLNLKRFALLGYSMGARLALYIALTYPEKMERLIPESGSPGLATEAERVQRRAQDEALADRIEREGIPAFVDYWENLPLFAPQKRLPPDAQAKIRVGRLQNRAVGLANSLRGMGTGAQPSLWDALPKLTIPTQIVTGALDLKFDQIGRAMAEEMPNSQQVVITDAGHTPHVEQLGRFVEAISIR
jgi:2-succinyl-6-hydroxy-2,4-cyclohexadiene-1-carboxylate synthase